MKDEVFDAFTKWGELGYAIDLHYGQMFRDDQQFTGWCCLIRLSSVGSFSYEALTPPPIGYHPTSAHEAARMALREAAKRWPEMAERAQP